MLKSPIKPWKVSNNTWVLCLSTSRTLPSSVARRKGCTDGSLSTTWWETSWRCCILEQKECCFTYFKVTLVIPFCSLAEKPVEHLHAPRREKDRRVHGSRWSIHTDCFWRWGWSQRAWLHAHQTLRLSLQCLHTQFPLLRQKRGREECSGQSTPGTQPSSCLMCDASSLSRLCLPNSFTCCKCF